MNKTEVQLFDNEYKTRCDTFGCGESAVSMIGRPDSPLSTALNLCAICTEQLVRSVLEQEIAKNKEAEISEHDELDLESKIAELFEDDEEDIEGTLEELLEGVRSHAELDEVAKELGVKGLPTKETKLVDRKQYILDYDFPADGE